MNLERVLPYARTLLSKAVKEGAVAVDATMGNGHDTLFLANLVGRNGKVYAFDVQAEAVETTRRRLAENGAGSQAVLFHIGHENMGNCIPESDQGKIAGAIFNLGYLPGSDKQIITKPGTTISAVRQLLDMMAPEGLIVLVVYHGHEGGAEERENLLDFAAKLGQKEAHVLKYQFINQANHPPFIIAIEKR